MFGISFEVELHGFAELRGRMLNMSPAAAGIGALLVRASQAAFAGEKPPGGLVGWAPLAQRTVRERERAGFPGTRPILRRSGNLANSVRIHLVEAHNVVVGTDVAYAGVHMTGRKTPTGMPARVFLGIGAQEQVAMLSIVNQHLAG
jgi:phage gpG-like protein